MTTTLALQDRHALVDNAPFAKTLLNLWQRVLAVHLTDTLVCTQAVRHDPLAGGWGSVVDIASSAGQTGCADPGTGPSISVSAGEAA